MLSSIRSLTTTPKDPHVPCKYISLASLSNGWLSSFVNRHNIVFCKMSGERGDVDDAVVSDWLTKLPSICEGYEPKDIFKMDETGLFYR